MPVQKRKEIAMANMYRDVNLSEVNESYIGKELKVAGWVENIRDHGGVSFIDLRDMYGVLQVVLRDTTLLDGIHKEECIAIEGIMEQRDEETYNPKIPSGTIELEGKKISSGRMMIAYKICVKRAMEAGITERTASTIAVTIPVPFKTPTITPIPRNKIAGASMVAECFLTIWLCSCWE